MKNEILNPMLFDEARDELWRTVFNEIIIAEIFAVTWREYSDSQTNDWLPFLRDYSEFEREFGIERSNRMIKDLYYYHMVSDDEKVNAIKSVADNFAMILWSRWTFDYNDYLNAFDKLISTTYVDTFTAIDQINFRMFNMVAKQIRINKKNDR